MNPQDQYDDAMFDFSRDELGRAIAKLRTSLVVKPALYEVQLAFGRPHSLCYVQAGDKPKTGHRLPAHRPIGLRRHVSRQSELTMAKSKSATVKLPENFPGMPRQRKKV